MALSKFQHFGGASSGSRPVWAPGPHEKRSLQPPNLPPDFFDFFMMQLYS